MTDALLKQSSDGGEIEFIAGQITLAEGLESSAYLSIFGGNVEDSGQASDNAKEWWGNKGENDPARRYRSAFQHAIRTLPLTPANLVRFEDAADLDLAWMTDSIAQAVEVTARIPALNTLELEVVITVDNEEFRFVFTQPGQTQ